MPGQEHAVTDADHLCLVTVLPASTVVHGRGHQQDRRRRRAEEAGVVHVAQPLLEIVETRGKRHGQEECEQELRTR